MPRDQAEDVLEVLRALVLGPFFHEDLLQGLGADEVETLDADGADVADEGAMFLDPIARGEAVVVLCKNGGAGANEGVTERWAGYVSQRGEKARVEEDAVDDGAAYDGA